MDYVLYAIAAVGTFVACGRMHSHYLDHIEEKLWREYGILPSWKREGRRKL